LRPHNRVDWGHRKRLGVGMTKASLSRSASTLTICWIYWDRKSRARRHLPVGGPPCTVDWQLYLQSCRSLSQASKGKYGSRAADRWQAGVGQFGTSGSLVTRTFDRQMHTPKAALEVALAQTLGMRRPYESSVTGVTRCSGRSTDGRMCGPEHSALTLSNILKDERDRIQKKWPGLRYAFG
jgi:hypothetical protein